MVACAVCATELRDDAKFCAGAAGDSADLNVESARFLYALALVQQDGAARARGLAHELGFEGHIDTAAAMD